MCIVSVQFLESWKAVSGCSRLQYSTTRRSTWTTYFLPAARSTTSFMLGTSVSSGKMEWSGALQTACSKTTPTRTMLSRRSVMCVLGVWQQRRGRSTWTMTFLLDDDFSSIGFMSFDTHELILPARSWPSWHHVKWWSKPGSWWNDWHSEKKTWGQMHCERCDRNLLEVSYFFCIPSGLG